ncbi:MAG TPA: sugar phosphate isomerase/epimerase [Solirubrobacteraceae bacterium]|nr:sugar phosphate isomerase/epimerase [Solirubrobacteraceae bacterium]
MAVTAKRRQARVDDPITPVTPVPRLGIDQPAGWWPAAPRLKSYEAAGFAHLQMWTAPGAVLADEALVSAHAGALAERLGLTGLRLILHAPVDLIAGTAEHDAQLDGALRYAAVAGAELIVLHGAGLPQAGIGQRERLAAERRSLRGRLGRAARLGVKLAFENLAPAYPGCECLADDVAVVAELVDALDSEQVGICLDLGHAHIAADRAGLPLTELIAPMLDRVLVFHLHDNFGARPQPGWAEPERIDLHLPPGAGSLPWAEIAPIVARHAAPLVLEVHPSARPEPGTLAVMTRELLGIAAPAAAVG